MEIKEVFKEVRFEDVPNGTTFIYQGEPYMKVFSGIATQHNCVDLSCGRLYMMAGSRLVIPMNMKLVYGGGI